MKIFQIGKRVGHGQISKNLRNDKVKEGLAEEELEVEGPSLRGFAIVQITLPCVSGEMRGTAWD